MNYGFKQGDVVTWADGYFLRGSRKKPENYREAILLKGTSVTMPIYLNTNQFPPTPVDGQAGVEVETACVLRALIVLLEPLNFKFEFAGNDKSLRVWKCLINCRPPPDGRVRQNPRNPFAIFEAYLREDQIVINPEVYGYSKDLLSPLLERHLLRKQKTS